MSHVPRGRNETASAEIRMRGSGMHARPSVAFTDLARSFPCVIEMEVDGSGEWVNAKSIVKVMATRARHGSMLKIAAHGARAGEAVSALRDLVEANFGEAIPHAGRG